MVSILVVGYQPEAVDFSDPLVPKGMTSEKVAQGLEADQRKIEARGWQGDHLLISIDGLTRASVLDRLAGGSFDCVVVGGGIRVTSKHVGVLEDVVNAVREGAPGTPIAFNEGPDTSAEAAARVLGAVGGHSPPA